jgi:hypothetical protein
LGDTETNIKLAAFSIVFGVLYKDQRRMGNALHPGLVKRSN